MHGKVRKMQLQSYMNFREIIHPKYDDYGYRGPQYDYDFALLKLETEAFGVKTLPVCMTEVDDYSFPNETQVGVK